MFFFLIGCLLLHRNFGNIACDTVQKYENVEVFELQKLEKLSIKTRKAELDIKCLRDYKIFNVTPRFSSFNYYMQMKLIQNLFIKDYCKVC